MKKLDQLDKRILATLQSDARITNQALADAVSLSPSACLTRVRRLESEGLIASYRAVLSLEKVTPFVEAFAEVTLENHSVRDFARFDKAIKDIAEVIESYKISGPYDYLLKFVCADVRAYNALSDQMIESSIGIEKLTTLIILDNTKAFAGYPLASLL